MVAVGEVIAFSASPNTLWFLAVDFVIGKLYANSLLATLNSRQSLKAASGVSENTIHLSDIEFGPGSSRAHSEGNFEDFRRGTGTVAFADHNEREYKTSIQSNAPKMGNIHI